MRPAAAKIKRPLVIVPVSGKLVVLVGIIVGETAASNVEIAVVGDIALANNISVGDSVGVSVGVSIGVAVDGTWLKAINRL